MKIIKNNTYFCPFCQNKLDKKLKCDKCNKIISENDILDNIIFVFGQPIQVFEEDFKQDIFKFLTGQLIENEE